MTASKPLKAFGSLTFVAVLLTSLACTPTPEASCKAVGDMFARCHKLVDAVFDKAKGEQNQEAGGVIVTLLAYCAAKGLRLDKLADDEIARIQKLPVEHFRKRQQAKADAGVAAPPG